MIRGSESSACEYRFFAFLLAYPHSNFAGSLPGTRAILGSAVCSLFRKESKVQGCVISGSVRYSGRIQRLGIGRADRGDSWWTGSITVFSENFRKTAA